jgi:hypothetical protein
MKIADYKKIDLNNKPDKERFAFTPPPGTPIEEIPNGR